MNDFRYVLHDMYNIGCKIIEYIYSVAYLRICKKLGLLPRDMNKTFKEILNLAQDNFKTLNRVNNLSNEIINNRIKKIDEKRGKNLRKLNITWQNMDIIMTKMYNNRDITLPINMTRSWITNKWKKYKNKITKKWEKKVAFQKKKNPEIFVKHSQIRVDLNDNNELFVCRPKADEQRGSGTDQCDHMFFEDIEIAFIMNKEFCMIKMERPDNIKTVEDIEKFLANKGPNYSVRTKNNKEINKNSERRIQCLHN